MMTRPDGRHRRSIRLRDFDYSQAGAYFVTVCAQGRSCLFGRASDGVVEMNDAGRMVERWWLELDHKFPCVDTDAYVLMPDHFHGIVVIVDATRRGEPVCSPNDTEGGHAGPPLRVAPSDIMQWFKTMTTNDYIRGVKTLGWMPFAGRVWQRNYYEHVVRDEDELIRLRQYIVDNPANWTGDADEAWPVR